MRKLWIGLISMFSILLVGCNGNAGIEYQYVSLRINPHIDFMLDKENHITHYGLLNEEAEILLAGEDLIGKTLTEAIHLIIDRSMETGYIDILSVDNVIAILAESSQSKTYQEDLKTMINAYLFDQAIGCVVVDQQTVGLVTHSKSQDQEQSVLQSRMIQSFMTLDSSKTQQDLNALSFKELYESLKGLFQSALTTFREITELSRLSSKTKMISDLETLVTIYRNGVESGDIVQPDVSGVLQQFLNQFAIEVQKISQRNQDRTTRLSSNNQGLTVEYLIGVFEFSLFRGNVPYTLNYHRIIFHENHYEESWSITGEDGQTMTNDYIGTWAIVDGKLQLSYPGTNPFVYFYANGNICFYNQEGRLFTAIKTTE